MRLALPVATAVLASVAAAKQKRPNIVFVLTDDQDAHMDSIEHMPLLNKHVVEHGTTFEKHYCTIAICCPSRVSLWTGKAAHNTNVTDVEPPWGGYPKFIEEGFNNQHLSYWLQEGGYNTYYVGKLYNAQNTTNYNKPYIKGYTQAEFLLDPDTYKYYNFTSTRNGQEPVKNTRAYNTDFLAEVTYEFMDEGINDKEKPFFITVAPIAPHTETIMQPRLEFPPPVPAERHLNLFKDYKIPRTPNFNPDKPSSVNWISQLEKLTDDDVEYIDEFQRLRLRSLQAVDEMVEGIVKKLEDAGVLDNTYIIYSSDNGFHAGQHRLPPSKGLGLETDINVPLVIRGPGVPAGVKRNFPTSHTDLAPTIMKMAGLPIGCQDFDGHPIELREEPEKPSEHVNVEYWGFGGGEGRFSYDAEGHTIAHLTTYKGLRIVGKDYGFYYSVWCTNESELYDMKADPGQINNLMASNATGKAQFQGQTLEALVNRLDALMMVLKSCKRKTCVEPWKSLHPDGSVTTLEDALKPKYDEFYRKQPKVSYNMCSRAYIKELEGPMDVIPFGVAECKA